MFIGIKRKDWTYDLCEVFCFVMLRVVAIAHSIINGSVVAFNGSSFGRYNIAFKSFANSYVPEVVGGNFGGITRSIDNIIPRTKFR